MVHHAATAYPHISSCSRRLVLPVLRVATPLLALLRCSLLALSPASSRQSGVGVVRSRSLPLTHPPRGDHFVCGVDRVHMQRTQQPVGVSDFKAMAVVQQCVVNDSCAAEAP